MLYVTAPGTGTQLMTLVPSPPPPATSGVGVSRASRTSTAGRNVRRLPFQVLLLVDSSNFTRIDPMSAMRLPSLSPNVKDFILRAPRAITYSRAFALSRSTHDKIQLN